MHKALLSSLLTIAALFCEAQQKYPFFTIEINKKLFATAIDSGKVDNTGVLNNKLRYTRLASTSSVFENEIEILLRNISSDTIEIRNLVPFGASPHHVYITGLGEHSLSRTHLFIPGKLPVNIICPDNAWELGFSCIENKG